MMKSRTITVNIFLALCVFLLSTCLIDIILACFTRLGKDEKKVWISVKEGRGNCYSSDPKRYFPISLDRSYKDREYLKKILLPCRGDGNVDDIDQLIKETPHCIIYDTQKRVEGYFPAREDTVFIIGDSFVEGEGVRGEDTLGYLLGEKFKKANFKNEGRCGADVEKVFVKFSELINAGNGKGIIYFYNLNDILVSGEIACGQKYIIDFQNFRWRRPKQQRSIFADILSNSTIYRLVERAIILHQQSELTTRSYLDMYFSQANRKEREKTIDTIISMGKIAEEKGVNFCLVIYPLFYKDSFGRYPFKPIHDFLRDVCRRNNILCIDALPAFDKYYSLKKFIVHPVDYHPNGLANRTVVDYLWERPDFSRQMFRN